MIIKMYTIRDRMTEFGFPMPMENQESAKRYFRSRLNEVPIMKDNPEDFTLWYVGLFDTENGTINTAEPVLVEGEYIPYVEEGEKVGESL